MKTEQITVRDSDRKAAMEMHCEYSREWLAALPPSQNTYIYQLLCDSAEKERERLALIIARHHAEERAAVERLKAGAEAVRDTLRQIKDLANINEEARRMLIHCSDHLNAALTALRTASQSPEPEYEDNFKCATFDPAIRAAIPPRIRAKMDADRDAALKARSASQSPTKGKA